MTSRGEGYGPQTAILSHGKPAAAAAAIERMGTAVQRGRMNLFSAGGALAGEGATVTVRTGRIASWNKFRGQF